jgi:hypothetical protein
MKDYRGRSLIQRLLTCNNSDLILQTVSDQARFSRPLFGAKQPFKKHYLNRHERRLTARSCHSGVALSLQFQSISIDQTALRENVAYIS